jgi:exosome complex exonuclease RRP6
LLIIRLHSRLQADSGVGADSAVPISAHGMQVEVPYVPTAQRTTKQVVEVVDDSIVVVGQARQKKRKRPKTDSGVGGDAGDEAAEDPASLKKTKKQEKRDAQDGEEAFDFSAVPNILDDVPNSEDMRVKKKKKQKQGKGAVTVHGTWTD